jgi:hypothetical protein
MPRNGRIRIVGKREERETEEGTETLRELERELRRQWRRRRAALRDERQAGDDVADEPGPERG